MKYWYICNVFDPQMDFLELLSINTSYFFKCWKLVKVFERNCIKNFKAMFLMLCRTFQCFIYLICELFNMITNFLILWISSIRSYVKKIVKEIIKKSKNKIDKFRLIFRSITYPLEGHCTPVEDKNINYFWKWSIEI